MMEQTTLAVAGADAGAEFISSRPKAGSNTNTKPVSVSPRLTAAKPYLDPGRNFFSQKLSARRTNSLSLT
jgi:hypothetical protein